jgi:hypothetical protein
MEGVCLSDKFCFYIAKNLVIFFFEICDLLWLRPELRTALAKPEKRCGLTGAANNGEWWEASTCTSRTVFRCHMQLPATACTCNGHAAVSWWVCLHGWAWMGMDGHGWAWMGMHAMMGWEEREKVGSRSCRWKIEVDAQSSDLASHYRWPCTLLLCSYLQEGKPGQASAGRAQQRRQGETQCDHHMMCIVPCFAQLLSEHLSSESAHLSSASAHLSSASAHLSSELLFAGGIPQSPTKPAAQPRCDTPQCRSSAVPPLCRRHAYTSCIHLCSKLLLIA